MISASRGCSRRTRRRTGRSPQHAARLDVARVGELARRARPPRAQLLVGEEGDRLDAVAQVAPELLDVGGAGEAAGHADDGDGRRAVARAGAAAAGVSPRRPRPPQRRRAGRLWLARAGQALGQGAHRRVAEQVDQGESPPSASERARRAAGCAPGPAAASGRRGRRSCRRARPARGRAPRARPRRCARSARLCGGTCPAQTARPAARCLGRRQAPCGRPCRWASAAARPSTTKRRRHHVLRQAAARAVRSRAGQVAGSASTAGSPAGTT